MPCGLVVTYQRFGEASCVHHQGRRHPVGFPCTLVSHKEGRKPHIHCRKTFRSCVSHAVVIVTGYFSVWQVSDNPVPIKGKAVPLQAWSGPEGSRKLRFPDFMTTAQNGGKVSLTHRLPLPPRKYTWYSFLLEAESTPGPQRGRQDYVTEKFQ